MHIGAHADAPSHYQQSAQSIDQVDLHPYIGPCQVIAIEKRRHERILPSDIHTEIQAPRILFKTNSFPNPNNFNTDFNSLSTELIYFLAENNCVLVGIDTPSVDPFNDQNLEAHHALHEKSLYNIEGIALSHVRAGIYELIALPLKIEGADASPIRAVLIDHYKHP